MTALGILEVAEVDLRICEVAVSRHGGAVTMSGEGFGCFSHIGDAAAIHRAVSARIRAKQDHGPANFEFRLLGDGDRPIGGSTASVLCPDTASR